MNIAHAGMAAVRRHELFDAENQANAVRRREDDFQKGLATRRGLTGQRDGDVRLRSSYEPNDQTNNQ